MGLVLITGAVDGPAAYVSGHIPSKVRKLTAAAPRIPSHGLGRAQGGPLAG